MVNPAIPCVVVVVLRHVELVSIGVARRTGNGAAVTGSMLVRSKINALIRALLMMIRGCAKPMGEEALGPSASMFQRVLAALDQSLAAATPS